MEERKSINLTNWIVLLVFLTILFFILGIIAASIVQEGMVIYTCAIAYGISALFLGVTITSAIIGDEVNKGKSIIWRTAGKPTDKVFQFVEAGAGKAPKFSNRNQEGYRHDAKN